MKGDGESSFLVVHRFLLYRYSGKNGIPLLETLGIVQPDQINIAVLFLVKSHWPSVLYCTVAYIGQVTL